MRRVALIGMNNPLASKPEFALWPDPVGCTGWRLWQMLHARTGATKTDYLRAFHRYNLTTDRRWDIQEARLNWDEMVDDLQENFDTVVLLGASVRQATGAVLPSVLITRAVVAIPHPSGLCRWYNEDRNRQLVEVILEELYTGAIGA